MENILTYKKDIPLNGEDFAKYDAVERLLEARKNKADVENLILKLETSIIELYKKSNTKTITFEKLGVKVTGTPEKQVKENSYESIISAFSPEEISKYGKEIKTETTSIKWNYERIWKDHKPIEIIKNTKAKLTLTVLKGE